MILNRLGPQDSENETVVAQAYPYQESEKHNLDDPQACQCYPETWLYYAEDGSIEMCLVDHKWTQ